ncbi:MAG: hypothetical protein IJ829_02415 [Kiritimatiellae bacterium]|nr:hypothetical protein [Kiritimatiellia bacterium]
MRRILLAAALASACAGCFTLYETDYPDVQMSAAADAGVSVQVAGFEADVTTFVPVYGYQTYYHYGSFGRRGGYWGPSTVATETYIPQTRATDAYRDRAVELLEASGFDMKNERPDYRVEVKFAGPIVTDGDRAVEAAWTILSALSADYGVQAWTARLKIYDVATGRLVMHHDYRERYQAVVWGPLPLFSPGGSDKTSNNAVQNWCLTALTDRTIADATAFLSTVKKPAAAAK